MVYIYIYGYTTCIFGKCLVLEYHLFISACTLVSTLHLRLHELPHTHWEHTPTCLHCASLYTPSILYAGLVWTRTIYKIPDVFRN